MATTTPNFGWTVPTSSDLVKNGATAIETLGDAIDASLVDLKGGTTGQVLSKASNTDMDFTWVSDATGIPATIFDAKGDIIAATAADTASRLAVGTNGQVLTADSTAATGLKWASAGSSFSGCRVTIPSTYAISNNTLTTLTWGAETYDTDSYHDNSTNNSRLTIPTGKSGYYLITNFIDWAWSNSGYRQANLTKNGTNVWSAEWGTTGTSNISSGANSSAQMVLNLTAGDYLELKVKQDSGGNLSILGNDVGLTNPSFFGVVYLGA